MVFRAVVAALLVAISVADASQARPGLEASVAGPNSARVSRKTGSIAGRVIHPDGAAAEGAHFLGDKTKRTTRPQVSSWLASRLSEFADTAATPAASRQRRSKRFTQAPPIE